MNKSMIFRSLIIIFLLGTTPIPRYLAAGNTPQEIDGTNKPPDVIQGGEWKDDFWIGQLQESENIDVQVSHLFLKYKEQLHWTQTWTAHFDDGEFWHTEAISDSVRLAWNDAEQNYFSTGTYTSTVYGAGKAVDWSTTIWRYSGIPDGLVVEFRTGNVPIPDNSWTAWQIPNRVFMEDYCAYTYNSDETQCYSSMVGIHSSKYIQYRGLFTNNDTLETVALYEIDFLYGIHNLSGMATSILIPPVDLLTWESVIITSTIPTSTTLVIDILDPNGMVLLPNVTHGMSLAGIDPHNYPAIKLRAHITTSDESISPDIDVWGFRWRIVNRFFLPYIYR
jgi:hypothetical protein